MQLRSKVIGAAGIAALVAAGGFAFTESNTLPGATTVGYDSVTATGGTVTNISYTFGGTSGADITEVAFHAANVLSNTTTVHAGLGTGADDPVLHDCAAVTWVAMAVSTDGFEGNVTCNISPVVTAKTATSLGVLMGDHHA